MTWRRGVSVSVGALVVAVTVGGCARKELGVRNTAPIREETTTTPARVVTEPPTTAVTTTLAPTPVPAADPKPVGDDYRGTVIVKAVPKTDLEREILNATVALLGERSKFQMLNVTERELLSEVLVGAALTDFVERGVAVSDQLLQMPGKTDRVVIDSIVALSPDTAKAVVCEVDGTIVYVRDTAGRFVLDDPGEISTVRWELQVVRVAEGWRIGVETGLQTIDGFDKCAR
jgi:hypothetical protein